MAIFKFHWIQLETLTENQYKKNCNLSDSKRGNCMVFAFYPGTMRKCIVCKCLVNFFFSGGGGGEGGRDDLYFLCLHNTLGGKNGNTVVMINKN